MPFVRIDLQKGRSAEYRKRVGGVVHKALISVGVPRNDRCQVIQEHEEGSLAYDQDYRGIVRSRDFIAIQITWNEGRNVEQKRALYRATVDGLHTSADLRPEDVLISLVEVKKENWSFGNGEAQYAP